MEKSESIKNLMTALLEFQKSVPSIKKTATNPFFNSKYAPLDKIVEIINPVLHTNNLVISQYVGSDCSVETTLYHTESGEFSSEKATIPRSKDDPQGAGSAITYLRRYSISAILNLVTEEDDDGNGDNKENASNKKDYDTTKPTCWLDKITPELEVSIQQSALKGETFNEFIKKARASAKEKRNMGISKAKAAEIEALFNAVAK